MGYFFNPNIHPYQEFLKRLHCLERYTALRPVKIIYDQEYNLAKYLIGALEAMYDPPDEFKPVSKPTEKKDKDVFSEKVAVSEQLQIKLTPKESSDAKETSLDVQPETSRSQKDDKAKDTEFNPRCGYCISLRLGRTAALAAKAGFDAFTTTLLLSKYQPHEYIRSVGEKLAAKHGIKFYYRDFRAGWKESIKISKELSLYRQQYCGCIFSEFERFGPE